MGHGRRSGDAAAQSKPQQSRCQSSKSDAILPTKIETEAVSGDFAVAPDTWPAPEAAVLDCERRRGYPRV